VCILFCVLFVWCSCLCVVCLFVFGDRQKEREMSGRGVEHKERFERNRLLARYRVCERERDQHQERGKEMQRERAFACACVCVRVRVRMYLYMSAYE